MSNPLYALNAGTKRHIERCWNNLGINKSTSDIVKGLKMDKLKFLLANIIRKDLPEARSSLEVLGRLELAMDIIEYMDDKPEALLKRLKVEHDEGTFPGCGI